MKDIYTASGAVLSPDQAYRYALWRRWDAGDAVTFLMLNPSTASTSLNDATIRKCIGFAKRWGYDAIHVLNLFALRSRDPQNLVIAADPIGPDYDGYFEFMLKLSSNLIIAAWGCESTLRKSPVLKARPAVVIRRIREIAPLAPIECLGMSKTGTPYHPLMLSYDRPRLPFEVAA